MHNVRYLISRRSAVGILGGVLAAGFSCRSHINDKNRKIIFQARGRIGMMNDDGTNIEYLSFDVPGQVNWQAGPVFSDKRRIILTSFEEGKAWEGNVRTHLYIYDLESRDLQEIAEKDRPAPFLVCAGLMPCELRIITGPVIDGEQRVITMNLDGSDQVEVTKAGQGFTYGVSLSPDSKRFAFHATGKEGYRIFTCNLDGSGRKLVAGNPDHLYFGTSWSPDGEWILFLDCLHRTDPGHDWADICIARPDGRDFTPLTKGQSHWFGTSYGTPETRGGGSNLPQWSPDGKTITYTKGMPGSVTAWIFQPARPDTNHFNRDYMPEQARGGTEICLLDPSTGRFDRITANESGTWDFRTAWSHDGEKIAFCRARIGEPSELWIMNSDGTGQRFLTRGENGMGVDHPKFL